MDVREDLEGALEAGLHPENAFWSPTVEQAAADSFVAPTHGDVAVLKASRGMRLERLADVLRKAKTRMPVGAEVRKAV